MTPSRREWCSQPSHLYAYNNLSTCKKSCPVRIPGLPFQWMCLLARILIWKAKQTHAFGRHFSWATVNSFHVQLARKARGRGGFPHLVSSEWLDNMGTEQNKADVWAWHLPPPPLTRWQITKLRKAGEGGHLRRHLVLLRKEDQSGRERQNYESNGDKGTAWTFPRMGTYIPKNGLASIQSPIFWGQFLDLGNYQHSSRTLTCHLALSHQPCCLCSRLPFHPG